MSGWHLTGHSYKLHVGFTRATRRLEPLVDPSAHSYSGTQVLLDHCTKSEEVCTFCQVPIGELC